MLATRKARMLLKVCPSRLEGAVGRLPLAFFCCRKHCNEIRAIESAIEVCVTKKRVCEIYDPDASIFVSNGSVAIEINPWLGRSAVSARAGPLV